MESPVILNNISQSFFPYVTDKHYRLVHSFLPFPPPFPPFSTIETRKWNLIRSLLCSWRETSDTDLANEL